MKAQPPRAVADSPSSIRPNSALSIALPPELVELVARRAAELVADRQAPPDDGGFLDVAGAADFLACSRSRIYTMVSAGRLPVQRDGSRLLFDRAELRRYVENGGAKCP